MVEQRYNPIFFEAGRVVHLENEQTGRPFCNHPGGYQGWPDVPIDVPKGCRRCVAIASERAE